MKKSLKRIIYLALFVLFTAIEVLIALYVHDSFVRPYIGDIIVVVVIYCAVRVIIPERCALLPLWVFLFATAVELSQYFDLVTLLHLENNRFMKTLIGATFDISDIICYGVGCLLLGVVEFLVRRRKRPPYYRRIS